ncbi:MAG: hypothetical protein J1D89_00080 [Agathobacter sp.]|nr:hypothetical protein [Agathobacter sp.]
MRFKYYLRGCGFGIMFTAIMLTVAFHTRGVKEISNEEVIRRAEALGMVMPEETEDFETPDDSGESQAEGDGQPEEDEK